MRSADARFYWYFARALDVTYYGLLMTFALNLRYSLMSEWHLRILPIAIIAVGSVTTTLDIWGCRKFYRNCRRRPEFSLEAEVVVRRRSEVTGRTPTTLKEESQMIRESKLSLWEGVPETFTWAREHMMPLRFIGFVFVVVAVGLALSAKDPMRAVQAAAAVNATPPPALVAAIPAFGGPSASWSNITWDELHQLTLDENTRAVEVTTLMNFLEAHGYPSYLELCVLLAMGVFFWSAAFAHVAFVPNQRLGILVRSIFSMMETDVTAWLGLLVFSVLTYGVVVFLCYPTQLGHPTYGLVNKFDHPLTSFQAMIELALLGLEFEMEFVSADAATGNMMMSANISPFSNGGDVSHKIDAIFFLLFYVMYTVLVLILLLNLLIAMMSTTYAEIMEQSVLKWRVDFARLVLKIELQAEYLATPRLINFYRAWEMHAGEKQPDGRFLKKFRHVDKNEEGIEMSGGNELFDETEMARHEH